MTQEPRIQLRANRVLTFPSPLLKTAESEFHCRWENDFFEIPNELAKSVFDVDDDIVLHRRQAVAKLYKKLDRVAKALVKGPPGCGKSTCMFARALTSARDEGIQVLWIALDGRKLFVIRNSLIEEYKIGKFDLWTDLADLIELDDHLTSEHIYVDQCQLNHQKGNGEDARLLQSLVQYSAKVKSRRIFAITSDGSNNLNRSGFAMDNVVGLEPWTIEEYIVVLKNPHALEKFARSLCLQEIPERELEKKIKLKFYFAGISARFFFDKTIEKIRTTVLCHLSKVASYDNLYNGNTGNASSEAVNHLSYEENQSLRLSSRFIADKLLDRGRISPRTFTSMALNLGSQPNRGGIGVLFELYTLAVVSRDRWNPMREIRAFHKNKLPYCIPTPIIPQTNRQILHYSARSEAEIYLQSWYKPFKPTNPGFDAFFAFGTCRSHTKRLEELVIVFIQVTCGKEHDLNPQDFASAAMSISRRISGYDQYQQNGPKTRNASNLQETNYTKLYIEIVFAIPNGRKNDFVVKRVDVLASLANLDRRWCDQNWVSTEVPKSRDFLVNSYDVPEDEFME